MDCLLSIVIPFYCTPKELFRKCMSSLLSAQLDCMEIIVVNDGSSEEYTPILDSFQNEKSVRVIHTPNAGVSSARNRGIHEAKGKWIMFVDSDDYVNPAVLVKAVHYIQNHQGDIVILNGGCDYNGTIRYNTTFLQEGKNYAADEKDKISIMESALSVGKIPQGYIQYYTLGAPYSKMLRTNFLRQNHLEFDTKVKLAEDALFSLYLYQHAKDIQFLNWNIYYYVNNPSSATRKFRPGFSVDMDVFFDHVKQFMTNYHLEEELKKAYYVRAQFEIYRCIRLEYFHPDNNDPDATKKFNQIVKREPYYMAMTKEYSLGRQKMKKTRNFLLRHGMINLSNTLGKIHFFLHKTNKSFSNSNV